MGITSFLGHGTGSDLGVPRGYRSTVDWLPRIGDIVPNFIARTTAGKLQFHEWAEGNWVLLFSQPGAFTPVCSTEIASLADASHDFRTRNVKLLGLSQHSQGDQQSWMNDVERIFDVRIDIPIIEDLSGALSKLFGMSHPKDDAHCPIRKTFIVDPNLKIRMIAEYPTAVGRSIDETLRIIDALQIHDRDQVSTPSDWLPGDRCLLPLGMTDAEATALYGTAWEKLSYYLKAVQLPESGAHAGLSAV